MNISIIGYGNVSYNLCHAFSKGGHTILSIHGRNKEEVKKLAVKYQAKSLDITDPIPKTAQVVLLCIKDDSIGKVSQQLIIDQAKTIICHTSGSVHMDAISIKNGKKGVFYPLQTIRKDSIIDFTEVPICINGESSVIIKTLSQLAKSISKNIYLLTDIERRKAHLAAVIVNNFTNHIITEAYDYLKSEQIPIELMQPLLKETVNKLLLSPPDTTQTGPAKRNDQKTIQNHLDLIKGKDLEKLYHLLSESIIEKHSVK